MIAHLQLWTAWLFVYVGMPLAWTSVFLHLRTPWRKTVLGKHLLCYSLVIAAIMSFASARFWWYRRQAFPDWLTLIQFSTYVALVGVMGWRVWLQARALKK